MKDGFLDPRNCAIDPKGFYKVRSKSKRKLQHTKKNKKKKVVTS